MGKLRGLVRRDPEGFWLRVVVDPPVNDLPEFNDSGPFASESDAKRDFGRAVRALRTAHAKTNRAKWVAAA